MAKETKAGKRERLAAEYGKAYVDYIEQFIGRSEYMAARDAALEAGNSEQDLDEAQTAVLVARRDRELMQA